MFYDRFMFLLYLTYFIIIIVIFEMYYCIWLFILNEKFKKLVFFLFLWPLLQSVLGPTKYGNLYITGIEDIGIFCIVKQ